MTRRLKPSMMKYFIHVSGLLFVLMILSNCISFTTTSSILQTSSSASSSNVPKSLPLVQHLQHSSTSALVLPASTERVDFSRKNISSFPVNFFCESSNKKVSFLNLTANQFTEVSSIGFSVKSNTPSTIISSSQVPACKVETLKVLDLTWNRIKVLTDRGFYILPQLESLILSHNSIVRAEESSLAGLSSLKRLDLSSNQLVALPPRFFQSVLGTLEELSLKNNSISVLPPGLFDGLSNLIELDLSHNSITSHWVGSSTFSTLVKLKSLDLGHNRMSRVDSGTFKSLIDLNTLHLQYNEIESIAEDAFSQLHNLQTLVLSHNSLSRLDSMSMAGLTGLTSLSLDNNKLEVIDENMFKNVTSLFELNFSNNKLRAVPSAIRSLSNLRSLDLSYNLITDINNSSYQGIEQLYGLNLESNRIGNLTKGVFSELPSLRILNLSKNRIVKIDQTTFEDVPDLHALRLDSNFIGDINGLFPNLRDLLMLNISVNRITWFDYALIPIGLQWLDIHGNQIESLGNYFELEAVLKLRTLDVSSNKLTEIDSNSLPDGIEIVYLNNNTISKIAPFTFMGKQNLTKIDLTFNSIQTLEQNAFRLSKESSRRKLPEFSVSGNPYVCDCHMEWFRGILQVDESGQFPRFIDSTDVVCSLPFAKPYEAILPLYKVKLHSFVCSYRSHCFALCHCCDFDACDCKMTCPSGCNCYYDGTWSNNIVDCSASSGHMHKVIPSGIPMDVSELYLDSNKLHQLSSHAFIGRRYLRVLHLNNSGISVINNRTFNGLKKLEVLNLKFNQLTTLHGYEFERLLELKELYLSYNQITSISNNTFVYLKNLQVLHLDHNHVFEFQVWNLKHNNYLMDIKLSHNSWSCECHFIEHFVQLLNVKRKQITDSNEIQCYFNETTALTLLAPDFNISSCTKFSPPGKVVAPQTPDIVPMVAVTGSLVIILMICLVFMIIYRREVSVWFYSRYGVRLQGRASASREEEKLFDCFISYSKKDEAFVTQILAPELEYGNPPFRLCLHYRDLPVASGYLSDAIVEAMEASRRSILVISENFLKGEWCRYEFKSAHLEVLRTNQRHKLILIFIGKINTKDFDPDIRFWLKTSTFLQWGEKMFWEKLRYAMPDVAHARKPYPEQTRDMTVAVHIWTLNPDTDYKVSQEQVNGSATPTAQQAIRQRLERQAAKSAGSK